MPVFKTCMKIIKSKLALLMIYIVVIVMISILMITTSGSPNSIQGSYSQKGCAITILDHDPEGAVSQGLKKFLLQTNREVAIEDDMEKLQDALYYENTEYILSIPEGFTDSFMNGEDIVLQKTSQPDSTERYYIDMQIDQYLNAVRFYSQAGMGHAEEIVPLVLADLSLSAEAEFAPGKTETDGFRLHIYYFNYLSYSMMALMILGISTILISFHQKDLYRRNLCAPIRLTRLNGEMILSTGVYAGACYLILVGCGLALYWDSLWKSGVLGILCLNFFIFSIVGIGIGFLTGVFVKNYNVQSAVANVITLSMSFLCGVFVPQAIMSPAVLKVSQFLPAYWYVRANDLLGSIHTASAETLRPVFECMGIQLLYAAALFALALLLSKKKQVTAS
jgi:ABC-2 type transport system permease protein